MNAQLCEYTKNYTGHFKWVNFKGYEIYLNNKLKKSNKLKKKKAQRQT